MRWPHLAVRISVYPRQRGRFVGCNVDSAPGDVTGFWPLFSAPGLFSLSARSLYSSALSFFCDFFVCHTEFVHHCCQCSLLSAERVKNLSYLKRNNCTHLFLRIINRAIREDRPVGGPSSGAGCRSQCDVGLPSFLWDLLVVSRLISPWDKWTGRMPIASCGSQNHKQSFCGCCWGELLFLSSVGLFLRSVFWIFCWYLAEQSGLLVLCESQVRRAP